MVLRADVFQLTISDGDPMRSSFLSRFLFLALTASCSVPIALSLGAASIGLAVAEAQASSAETEVMEEEAPPEEVLAEEVVFDEVLRPAEETVDAVTAEDTPIQDAAKDEDTLGQHMQKMKRQLRRFNRSITLEDGGKQANEDCTLILGHLIAAKALVPALAADQPEADRAGFVKRYQILMNDTIKAWLDVESAWLAGDLEETKKRLETFREFESKGHKAFKK